MSRTNFEQTSRAAVWGVIGMVVCAACSGGSNGSNTATTAGGDTAVSTSRGEVAHAPREPRRRRTRAEGAGADTTAAASAPAVPAPAAASVVLPSGTAIDVTSNARVCTNTYHVGDTFTGNTSEAINGNNGGELPSGSVITFRVTQVKNSNNMTQHGEIGIAIDSIAMNGANYPAEADITSAATQKVRASSVGQEATKAGIGTAAGAVLGQVIGHNAKSTIIGAAAGLAAGGATALATTMYDFCIPQNGKISLKLTSDTKI
jgi:hypothetical protein